MNRDELVNEADKFGDRVAAYARSHVAWMPIASALLTGWLLGQFAPRWTLFLVLGTVCVLAILAIWADHRK